MRRRPSLTGISRPRSMNLPFGLLSKKPVYVSGELAENVSRSGSIDWQNGERGGYGEGIWGEGCGEMGVGRGVWGEGCGKRSVGRGVWGEEW